MTHFMFIAAINTHHLVMSVIAILVVFTALFLLYLAYTVIGKLVNQSFSFKKKQFVPTFSSKKKQQVSNEVAAAVAMALNADKNEEVIAAISLAMHEFTSGTVHDTESYIITIKR